MKFLVLQISDIHIGDGSVFDPCLSIEILYHIFQTKKIYYKFKCTLENSNNESPGEIRELMILIFIIRLRGFHLLGIFMEQRASQPQHIFPDLHFLPTFLNAIKDSLDLSSDHHEDVIRIISALKKHLLILNEGALEKFPAETIKNIVYYLHRIYQKMSATDPPFFHDYFKFSRDLVFKLITAVSLPLKQLGWSILEEIIDTSIENRPPPKAYIVEGAGLSFINGQYELGPKNITESGWAKNLYDVQYVRKISENSGNPASAEDGAGKTLTLFRCTMRSQQQWWFISEADEVQPGTDKDIDYYQCKSKQSRERTP